MLLIVLVTPENIILNETWSPDPKRHFTLFFSRVIIFFGC